MNLKVCRTLSHTEYIYQRYKMHFNFSTYTILNRPGYCYQLIIQATKSVQYTNEFFNGETHIVGISYMYEHHNYQISFRKTNN